MISKITSRYSFEVMANGLTRVFDYGSKLSGLYVTETGEYYAGDLRRANLSAFC